MSRLSRLRSFWRSLLRPTSRTTGTPRHGGLVAPHAAVNLLPGHGVSMRTKALGIPSAPAVTGTGGPSTITAVSSSFLAPGDPWAGAFVQTSPHHGSSFTERGWSTGATGIPGASGAPRGPAV